MAGGARNNADRLLRQAGCGRDPLLRACFGCHVEALLREAPALFANALFADPETLLARASHRRHDARLKHAVTRGIDAVGMPMTLEAGCDRLFENRPALGCVGDTLEGQSHRADVMALGPLGEVTRPGLDFVGNRLAIGEDPAVMRLERDVLALHVLAGRGRPRHAARIRDNLDDGGLVTGRELARPPDGATLPCPAPASTVRTAAGDRGRFPSRGRRSTPSSAAARCGRQESQPLLIPAAGDRRAANDFMSGRTLRKRRHLAAARTHLFVETGCRPTTCVARIVDSASGRLDLFDPPGDLRGAAHAGSLSARSAGSVSFASRRSFDP